MYRMNPLLKFIYLSVILSLSFGFLISIVASSSPAIADEETDGIEELIALDEEEELQKQQEPSTGGKSSEAEVLSKAQRIVLELSTDNAEKLIDRSEFVLVLGYAPWCARSAELMPRFAEAATALKELGSSLLMAKVDAERYPKVASNLGIKGFPTLLLFVNGSSHPYTGGLSSEEIVIWARKKTGVPVIRISSIAEASYFLKKHSTFTIGFFEKFKGQYYEEFVKAATSDNEIQFVETSCAETANALFPDVIKSASVFLGLVKSESERFTTFEDSFERDKILQFLDDNKFPLVTFLTELNSAKVYSRPNKLQVYVFAQGDRLKKLLDPFQEAARKFKLKIMFLFVDIKDENLAKPLLTLFGLEESEGTLVTAFDYKISSKYLLESDPTLEKIEEFCSGLLNGTQFPYYKSQPIPDNEAADVLTVVGKSFDDLVLRSSKNIILEVHAPWCFSCETTSKQVEKLAKHFKGLENLVFARIDASANEHPKLQVDDYPTLLFYAAGDKSNPVKLPAKSSLKDLGTLVNKYVKAQHQSHKDEL